MMLKVFFPVLFFTVFGADGQLVITRAVLDNRVNPVGVDTSMIRFGWELTATTNDQIQTAYEIGLATTANNASRGNFDVTTTRKISGRQSLFVRVPNLHIAPATTYYWKVRSWDQQDRPSGWSKIQQFTTGLFDRPDWQGAKWIGYEELPDSLRTVPGIHFPFANKMGNKCMRRPVVPIFRKESIVSGKVVSALAFISGLGQYELAINGRKIGTASLAPGWTHYDKHVLFNVFDITKYIAGGRNAIGVIVGNGFYNINRERYFKMTDAFGYPKMICLVKIVYEDGRVQNIISDSSWKTSPSPVVFSSIYGGEDFEATRTQEDWNKPAFNDGHWQNAVLVKEPAGQLVAESDYPVRVMDSFVVKKITRIADADYVYDFGQNSSGIIGIKVQGKKGQKIKFIPAELLDSSGRANQSASGEPFYYEYTCRGSGEEYWHPSFTYYGFRYVEVQGARPANGHADADLPRINRLVSLHTRNSNPDNGSFACSNDLFNRISTLINWAIKSNMQSVITDCPHREKLSWIEQDHLMGASIHYNFDIYHLYRKLISDLRDAQTTDGLIPDIAPEYVEFEGGFRDSPEWGSAAVILPWLVYRWYGDEQILAQAYPMIKKYVAYLRQKSHDNILDYGLGDWFDYGPNPPGEAQLTPRALTATAIYYYDVTLIEKIAQHLGLDGDASDYKSLAAEIKSSFRKKFFDSSRMVFSTGSQTAMAMPCVVGLVEEGEGPQIISRLSDSIRAGHYALTAGDVGFHYLVNALDVGGASQILYDMNNRSDVPGYGYQLKKGATALTESWPALAVVSNNHLMLGHIMEWFYDGLGGIDQSDSSIAYADIVIRPQFVKGVDSAAARFHSPYGWISNAWKRTGWGVVMRTIIPPNARATIVLPANMALQVFVNGKAPSQRTLPNGMVGLSLGSGNYLLKIEK